jgi:archaellum component FlaC
MPTMTNEELTSAVSTLSQRMAQLPTRAQIDTLTDLLTDYKTSTDQQLNQINAQITGILADIQDLKNRVQALEDA